MGSVCEGAYQAIACLIPSDEHPELLRAGLRVAISEYGISIPNAQMLPEDVRADWHMVMDGVDDAPAGGEGQIFNHLAALDGPRLSEMAQAALRIYAAVVEADALSSARSDG